MRTLKFYLTTYEAWEAIYKDCANAKYSIECEQYIVTAEGIGARLMELFCEKAKQHLRVKIMLDRIGSRTILSSSFAHELRSHGGEIYFYNHLQLPHLLQPWRWFPRDHIKTMLIDSKIAYTGSVCFDQKMVNWRDTHVRFTGPIIKQVRNDFDHLWQRFKGINSIYPHYHPSLDNPDLRYVVSMPTLGHSAIYDELKMAIGQARYAIYLTSPFFIPDPLLMELMGNATRRGVKIMLLISHISDATIADAASQSYFSTALAQGIRIFLYENGLLHAKSIVIDDNWATVGSSNLDYLSFYHNREANLIMRDKKTIRTLTHHFFNDLKHSKEILPEDWKKRPFSQKITEYFSRCISSYL